MPIAQKKTIIDAADWAEPVEFNPRATMGGNKPPLEELIPVEFRAVLLAEKPEFLTRLDDLIDAADRAKAEDDETLGRCGDLVKAYRTCAAHIDATHKAVKEPYLQGGRLVDAEKNALANRLAAAKAKVEGIGHAYVAKKDAEAKAERDRIAAEQRAAAERAYQAEQARLRAEQEAAAAARDATNEAERRAAAERATQAAREAEDAMAQAALAPVAPLTNEPVRSDAGATVSGSKDWACEVEDYAKAFKHVKNDAKVREAIDAAMKRLVKQTKGQLDLAGVRIWPVAKANFR